MKNHKVKCNNFVIGNDKPFTLIAGPCQLESETHAMKISNELKKITNELGINLIYKTSFDKANRTSLKGKRGLGLNKSLPIFDKLRKEEQEKGFTESVLSRDGKRKIPFFNLGPKNDWNKILNIKMAKKIEEVFADSMKDLSYR